MLDRCSSSSSCWLPLPSPKNERTSPTSEVSDESPAEGHLVAQVGELDLGAEVEPLDRAGVAQVEREGAAVDVVALERGVGEGRDLGDERVGPHEAGQRVAELQPPLVAPAPQSAPCPARVRRRSRPSASRRRRRRRAARASPPRSPRLAARRNRRGDGACPRGCWDRSAVRRCSRGTARTPRRCPRCRCGSRARTCSPSAGGCGSGARGSARPPVRPAACPRTSCAAAAGRTRSGTSPRRSARRTRASRTPRRSATSGNPFMLASVSGLPDAVVDLARERDQRPDVGVALGGDVLVDVLLVADRVQSRGGHDHRFGEPTHLLRGVLRGSARR